MSKVGPAIASTVSPHSKNRSRQTALVGIKAAAAKIIHRRPHRGAAPRHGDVHGGLRVGIADNQHAVAQLDPIDPRLAPGRNRERDQTRRS
jgi:hypothetical protein